MGTAGVFGALYYKTLSKKGDNGHGEAAAKTVEAETAEATERVPLTAAAVQEPVLPK